MASSVPTPHAAAPSAAVPAAAHAAAPAAPAPGRPGAPAALASLGAKGGSVLAAAVVAAFHARVSCQAGPGAPADPPANPFLPAAAPLAVALPPRPKGEARPAATEWQCFENLIAKFPAPARAPASVGGEARVALLLILSRASEAARAPGGTASLTALLAAEQAAGGFVCTAIDAFRRALAGPLAIDPVLRRGPHGDAVNRALAELVGFGPLCEVAGGLFLDFLKALGVLWADRALALGRRVPFSTAELRAALATGAAFMNEADAGAVRRVVALLRAELPHWAAEAARLRPARPAKGEPRPPRAPRGRAAAAPPAAPLAGAGAAGAGAAGASDDEGDDGEDEEEDDEALSDEGSDGEAPPAAPPAPAAAAPRARKPRGPTTA